MRQWVDDAKAKPTDKRWVMRCDAIRDGSRCPTQTEPEGDQPSLSRLVREGWFVAEMSGDACPECYAAGREPNVKPHPLMVKEATR